MQTDLKHLCKCLQRQLEKRRTHHAFIVSCVSGHDLTLSLMHDLATSEVTGSDVTRKQRKRIILLVKEASSLILFFFKLIVSAKVIVHR